MGATDGCECCDLFLGRFDREYATDTCSKGPCGLGGQSRLGCDANERG